MKIDFNEETHTYAINGDIASCSVTELLHKHGLAPNYEGIEKSVLRQSATKGKEIHKEFENSVNIADFKPKTAYGKEWLKWLKENCIGGIAEQMLPLNFNGLLICGTADFMGFNKNEEPIILDHKPKGTPKEYVQWQTSLLDYMARKFIGNEINDKPFKWTGAKHFFVNFYDKKNESIKVCEIEKIDDAEIEKLLRAEFAGEKYEKKEFVVDLDYCDALEKAEIEMAKAKAEYDLAKAKIDELRAELMKSFIIQGVKNWETPNGRYNYTMVEQTSSLTVDSTKLKREYPDIYNKVVKETIKKGYLRVTENAED